ncbi:carboxymuconolactone decarboxylase family protein [Halorubrum sp. JWXQ-INN 858]|uniref:carboxymuconolactone decarboxylase family protein n=1 Tax=Halorubrum sp. JWXQ-INN 858 TaxID=2690782 RepID=UPI00135A13FC|nr:carboxymuconolactone decarboxylase family protein [Halorubrum sp. JWXQ-INN 858]MWV64549.1 carboxymuconolactone decarboxylase family protein [Halorubrum sp. JWXQ-INN 858]
MTRRTPRVPEITSREQVPAGQRDRFDRIEESRGSVRGPFRLLLYSPEIADRVGHLGAYVRYESELPDPVREVAILTTARAYDCAYEYAAHEPIAREAGVDEGSIRAIAHDEPLEGLREVDAAVVRFGRELLGDNRVSDDAFDAVHDRFGTAGVTELVATFGYYGMLATVLNAFEMHPDADAPALP